MATLETNKAEREWQPTASIATLRKRAQHLQRIRDFFAARDVLEVETPLLSHTSVTDPYITSLAVNLPQPKNRYDQAYYLQTSPEYAMKRSFHSCSSTAP